MLEFFKTNWEKIWPLFLNAFDIAARYWKLFTAFIAKTWAWGQASLSTLLSWLKKVYFEIKFWLEGLYENNFNLFLLFASLLSLLIAFWFWMLWHAIKKEPQEQKKWRRIIIFLPLIGAFLYFFLRKRKLEKVRERHYAVERSFFQATRR